MKRLYAPWRTSYVRKVKDKSMNASCVFCDAVASRDDATSYVLSRSEYCFVTLNCFPYNAGHILVLPIAHEGVLSALSVPQRTDLMEHISRATEIVVRVLKADGVNVGLNLGEAGGGGIPQHLHAHVLPRWNGDTSFLPLLSDTKVVSQDLTDVYTLLKPHFDE